jgi:hypothetical protein
LATLNDPKLLGSLIFIKIRRKLIAISLDVSKSISYPLLVLPSSIGNVDLICSHNTSAPATPAYLNNAILEFDLSGPKFPSYIGSRDAPFGTHLPSPGNNAGYSTPITAIYNNEDAARGWTFSKDGTLQPQKTAALQSLLACDEKAGDVGRWDFKFGVQELDGTAPLGCRLASLVKKIKI